MYARNVSMHLKSTTFTEFSRTFNSEVVPLLRKQKGFQDAIMLVVSGEKEVQVISFWDEKENATAYNTTGYPQVVKSFERLIEGTPQVKMFEVAYSTLHKLPVYATA
jgi:heme-degrading monooxygenase HmoA